MNISQAELWMVRFYPQAGREISKLRPALVISHNTVGRLPLKTVVPLTDWKSAYAHYPWMIPIRPDKRNGLSKPSAIDCFQVKNFSNDRFVEKIGIVDAALLRQVHETVAKTFNPEYGLLNG